MDTMRDSLFVVYLEYQKLTNLDKWLWYSFSPEHSWNMILKNVFYNSHQTSSVIRQEIWG